MEEIKYSKDIKRKIMLIIEYFVRKTTYFNELVFSDLELFKTRTRYKDEDEIKAIIEGLCKEGYLTHCENDAYKVTVKGFQFYLEYQNSINLSHLTNKTTC